MEVIRRLLGDEPTASEMRASREAERREARERLLRQAARVRALDVQVQVSAQRAAGRRHQ